MEFSIKWNCICRICLQEGEMRSIYEKDNNAMIISEKIMFCSNVLIEPCANLPEQICTKCLEDLDIAYTFRNNCESSDSVLQSFVQANGRTDLVMYSRNGEVYKYKPPQGLNVKRIRKQPSESESENSNQYEVELNKETNENDEDCIVEDTIIMNQDDDSTEGFFTEEFQQENETESEPKPVKKHTAQVKLRLNGETVSSDQEYEVIEDEDICSMKPINNDENKTTKNQKIKLVAAETVTKSNGATHIRIRKKATTKPKPLKICDICGNTYKHKHALETHMRRHRNEKPFACEICGRAFVLNVELHCHMRTHTGQKPYACRFCDRRFSDFGSRIKHERTHTGERPYTCETCGKSFAYSYGLSSHMLVHTGEKRFSCEKCGKRFTKKHHLKNHLNTHAKHEVRLHGQNPTQMLEITDIEKPQPQSDEVLEQAGEQVEEQELNDDTEYLMTVLSSDPNDENYVEEISMVEIKEEEFTFQPPMVMDSV